MVLIGHSLGAQAQPSLIVKRCGATQLYKDPHSFMSNSQPLSPSFMRLWLALAVSAAVDVTKFRTCRLAKSLRCPAPEASRRASVGASAPSYGTALRRFASIFVWQEPKDGSLHAVQSVDLQGHLVTAKLKELTLELRFFRAHGSCGVAAGAFHFLQRPPARCS